MAIVKVKVEYEVEYPNGITEDKIDLNDIIRDTEAIKNIDLKIRESKK